jgi:haloacetate dehalogenase
VSWFEGFNLQSWQIGDVTITGRMGGNRAKPALVLIHGFPQSHVMWHRMAAALKDDYFIVMPDLRGYGDSSKLPASADHEQASKRAMASDIVGVLDQLGITQAHVCGHDRGARVAHRLALDHPARVSKLCLLDIAPTLDMYQRTDMAFARAYYHWFHLIQPSPLPEKMIAGCWRDYLHTKLGGWGGAGVNFIEPQALAEYERIFQRPETLAAMCEDYRASAGIDLTHDKLSRASGEKIACDTLILWGERGVVHRLFKPLELWQAQCSAQVTGQALSSGHFIPEELPGITAERLKHFFSTTIAS